MPERHERRLQWQAGRPLTVGALSLLPIEQVLLHQHAGSAGGWISVSKQPVAIVVRDAQLRCSALACDGSPMALQTLRERVPGLDAWLAQG